VSFIYLFYIKEHRQTCNISHKHRRTAVGPA